VPQIVDPAKRRDPGRALSRLPGPGAEVVQVEEAGAHGRKEQCALRSRRKLVEGGERDRLQGNARTLAFVLGVFRRPFLNVRRT